MRLTTKRDSDCAYREKPTLKPDFYSCDYAHLDRRRNRKDLLRKHDGICLNTQHLALSRRGRAGAKGKYPMPQPLRDQVFISYSHQNRWQDDATPSKFLNDSLSEHETLRRLQRGWQ